MVPERTNAFYNITNLPRKLNNNEASQVYIDAWLESVKCGRRARNAKVERLFLLFAKMAT